MVNNNDEDDDDHYNSFRANHSINVMTQKTNICDWVINITRIRYWAPSDQLAWLSRFGLFFNDDRWRARFPSANELSGFELR